ncbi:MAG: hypothetical protein LBJ11_03175 [Oscillospiraceae bacterium]|nr:hypothetical protein [Oscillospiraceae bacterium]
MNNEKATPPMRPSDVAIEKQTEYDPGSKIYTTHCGVCGKPRSQHKDWYRSRFKTFRKLRLQFNFCDTCNRWICEDCFFLDDGNGNSIGICTECAEKQGIKGLTQAGFEEKWPEIKKRIWEKNEAVMRAVEKEKRERAEQQSNGGS